MHSPFMPDTELAADTRLVTLHIAPDNDERQFVIRYPENMHIRVYRKQGTDYIAPYVAPVSPPRVYTYTCTPEYRDAGYIPSVPGASFSPATAVFLPAPRQRLLPALIYPAHL